MAPTLADSQRLVEALQNLNELQDTASKDIETAKSNVAEAKSAYERAETRLTSVCEARDQDIKDIQKRRQSVASLIADGSNAAGEHALLLGKPMKLRAIPNGRPVKLLTRRPDTVRGPGTIDTPFSDKPVKNTQFEPLSACTSIVRRTDGEWFEIRCNHCGANCDPVRDTYIKGVNGLQRHLRAAHGLSVTAQEAVDESVHRTLEAQEVDDIVAGKVTIEKVYTRSKPQRTAHMSAPTNGSADAIDELPWKETQGKRKRMPESDAHVKSKHPKGIYPKDKPVKEQSTDLSPDNQERLKQFRATQTLVDYSDDLSIPGQP